MKSREVPRKVRESPLTQLGIMTMTALVHTAWKDHREKTHRSVKMGKTLEAAVDIAGAPFTDTTRWAATHRIHHATPDANLLPTIEYTDATQC
jgi:fatty-acid desaturase